MAGRVARRSLGRPVCRSLTIGICISVGYKLLLRHNDLSKLRWDDGWCDIFPTHVRFYIDGRKNSKYMGLFLDIAIPASGRAPSVYHAAVLGKRHFKSGLVMRRCSMLKDPDTTKGPVVVAPAREPRTTARSSPIPIVK